ncbi:MAG: acetyl-CoA carboxylase biotin carboxyl carrier protein [Pirellulales bacterium]
MTNSATNSGDIFDVKKVRRLVELMKEHDLAEIDLRQGEQRIRLRRGTEPIVAGGGSVSYAPPTASTVSSAATSAVGVPPAEDVDLQVIKSPMVGTFYTAANPESPPFVKVGDHVGPESIVCIIEAMKVFNEIPAEVSGQVAAVLVENGAPVEYGQPLFKVNVRK